MKGNAGYILRCLAIAWVSFACSKYDSPENVHITAYGSVIRHAGTDDYYLRQDDGATLFVKDLWGYVQCVDGLRVKFIYEIMDNPAGTRTTANGEIYDVTLYYISPVPERDTVALSFIMEDEEHRQDSIGNDPLAGITGLFFSGDYVNVEYAYWRKGEGPHNMNLVVDDVNVKEGEVTVEIRHNAAGDVPEGSTTGFERIESEVSFYIRSLVPAGKNSLRIRFVWKEYGKSRPMERTGEYKVAPGTNKPIIVGSVKSNPPGIF